MNLLDFVILALATGRITSMLLEEDGPLEIFRNLRKTLRAGEFRTDGPDFDKFTEAELNWWLSTDKPQPGFISDLFSCPFCLSVWVGALLGWPGYFWRPVVVLCLPLALSAATLLLRPYDEEEGEEGDGAWQEPA